MNILIPMAGEGKRFIIGGFECPKPLIDVLGKPMIQQSLDTLGIRGRNIFIIKKSHIVYGLKSLLKSLYSDCKIIDIDYTTDGAACTCLLAERFINNDDELIIANCDQIMKWNGGEFTSFLNTTHHDGIVVTYYSNTPNNSYIKVDKNAKGILIREKEVISNESLNGIHYWKKGRYFVESAKRMIDEDDRVNNEFFIAPTYNYMIKDGKSVGIYHIDGNKHIAIGTPTDLYNFVNDEAMKFIRR